MTVYRRAPQVAKIADKLIRDVELHKLLRDVHIEYVWRDVASKSRGRIVLAKARKLSGLNAFLINAASGAVDGEANVPMFVVEVAEDTWGRLSEAQRKALVDHELCHCRVELDDDDEQVLSMRGHDLEEFSCIVERHGLWKSDVARFGAEVAEQLALAIDEAGSFLDPPPAEPDGDTE